MTKYGPIICDPNSEEAKKLIGKKVVASDYYARISEISELKDCDPLAPIEGKLIEVREDTSHPFAVIGPVSMCVYPFIREVIEEPPQYRPYKDTDEMVSDYCERFGVVKTDYSIPMIWLKTKYGWKIFARGYGDYSVEINDAPLTLNELFKDYTYLDGSPVGKEEA